MAVTRDEIRQAARKADKAVRNKPRKSNRTLSLTEDYFIELQKLAKGADTTASEIIDRLIHEFVLLYSK